MNIFRTISFVFIFAVALVTGFQSGVDFGTNSQELANTLTKPVNSLPEDQHNILLIHVDRIGKTNAHIKSVWLMIYYSDSPRVDFFPIFPSPGEDSIQRNQVLAESFYLMPNGQPGETFWQEMQTVNTWWDGYIMLDEVASTTLVDFLNGKALDDGKEVVSQNIKKMPVVYEDPQAVLEQQTKMYQLQCQNFTSYADGTDFFPKLISIHKHIHTNLNHDQIIEAWQLLQSYGKSLHCEFPTLLASTIP